MDSNNWRPPPAEQHPPSGDGGDWRSQLQHDSRQKIVNKIMETLKKYLPSGPEGLEEIKNIAMRFEDKIFTAATSQADYLRKISVKMLTMESKSQSTLPNPMPSNSSGVSRNPQEPVPSQNMQSQVHNQGQSVPLQVVPNQSQAQQLLAQNMQNNFASAGMQTSATLPNSLPMSSAASRNPTMQNISGISQSSMGNTMNQGAASNLFTNVQRQMQERQMPQNPQQYMYNQQLQQQMMKPKLQQGNMQQPLMQHCNQLQSMSQTPSVMNPSIISGMQQNHPSSIQHPAQSLQQHQQSVLRQQQQPQNQMPQQQLMGKQANTVNMQQNQLIGQQSNISDMQQQRMLGQQNNLPNLQSQQQTNNQNFSNIHQQQQLGHQNHVGGLPQQQQKMIGSQSGTNGMATNSVHMMQQQSKVLGQQQQSQSSASLLPGGGQQPQHQLMSHLQSQPTQLQQQLSGLQQQPNALHHSMQQRIQTPNPILQQQTMIDQQKHLFHSQRAPTEAPSTSVDSTAETGGTNAGDWQEETYRKMKAVKDLYFADLNEMYHKISAKLQQHDALPQPSKSEQLEKLRMFKNMVERMLHFLQTSKNNIAPSHRDKLPQFEKQVISLLNSQRPRRPVQPMPQGQILSPQLQTVQQFQQSHSQLPNTQSHVNGANPKLHSMNLQGSVPAIQQSNMSSLQHGSNLSSGQGNAPNSMQQVAMASMQQNAVNAPQQGNMASSQTQSGINLLQQNINPLLSNSTILQNQQHVLKQQIHNRNIQQQMMQKQQQQQGAPVQAHQIAQLNQVNDVNDIKMRQGFGPRSGVFPQHMSSAQRYAHPQLKPGASFPNSSPQLLHAMSPQVDQNCSPQIDQQNQQNLPSSVPKVGTALQSANSPFVLSPPTLAPSPMPGDSEKPAVSPLSNSNIGSIGTPGISASPFLECAGQDGTHGIASTVVTGKSGVTEQPLERLLRAIKSISPKALSASVRDMESVVTMMDQIAGPAPGNGSRATVGEDLGSMTKCRLQARNFLTQDGITGTKRMRWHTSAMPLNVVASVGSNRDSFKQLSGLETSEVESTATSSLKKARNELMEEIREINMRLIDTVVDISNEDVDPSVREAAAGGSEGTIVRCSFGAISLSPKLKLQYSLAHMLPIQPLRLLVPANYPNCSPVLLDKFPVDDSKDDEDLSSKAKTKLSMSLRTLSEPMTLRDIAMTWDDCARAAISEYAQKNGGGTFSSKYGTWENCLTAS